MLTPKQCCRLLYVFPEDGTFWKLGTSYVRQTLDSTSPLSRVRPVCDFGEERGLISPKQRLVIEPSSHRCASSNRRLTFSPSPICIILSDFKLFVSPFGWLFPVLFFFLKACIFFSQVVTLQRRLMLLIQRISGDLGTAVNVCFSFYSKPVCFFLVFF